MAMKLTRIKSTQEMFEWYLDILHNWPDSADILYDFEAEYQNEFAQFLISSSTCLNRGISKEQLATIVEKYKDEIKAKIEQRHELTNMLMSALDDRICYLLDNYEFEVTSGDYSSVVVESYSKKLSPNTQIFFELTDIGYQPTLLRSYYGQYNTSDLPLAKFIEILHAQVLPMRQ